MITLSLMTGGSATVATVAKGTTLQSMIASQVTASGREVSREVFASISRCPAVPMVTGQGGSILYCRPGPCSTAA